MYAAPVVGDILSVFVKVYVNYLFAPVVCARWSEFRRMAEGVLVKGFVLLVKVVFFEHPYENDKLVTSMLPSCHKLVQGCNRLYEVVDTL